MKKKREIFKSVAPIYQEALKKSGYEFKLHYNPQKTNENKKKHNRKRPVVWWNPPFSANVTTNVGAQFLKLLDKHFPKGHPLHKAFNRNTVKMSYRTTPNLKRIISSHNKKILRPPTQERTCNCKKTVCPLDGNCLLTNLVYQATVTPDNNQAPEETYIGMTGDTFKNRYGNHKKSFNHREYSSETSLSKHIWRLKDQAEGFNTEWKIVDRASCFSPVTRICALCVLEKYYIMYHQDQASLNSHEEIFKPCMHKSQLLLDNT